jgi:hypothetical protein
MTKEPVQDEVAMSDLEQIVAIIRDCVIVFCLISVTVAFLWICIRLNSVIRPLKRTSDNIESVVDNVVDKMNGPGSVLKGLIKSLSFLSRVKDKSD